MIRSVVRFIDKVGRIETHFVVNAEVEGERSDHALEVEAKEMFETESMCLS